MIVTPPGYNFLTLCSNIGTTSNIVRLLYTPCMLSIYLCVYLSCLSIYIHISIIIAVPVERRAMVEQ